LPQSLARQLTSDAHPIGGNLLSERSARVVKNADFENLATFDLRPGHI